MICFFFLNSLKLIKFKKRFCTKVLFPELRWGTSGLFIGRQYHFELIYFSFIKKAVKRNFFSHKDDRYFRRMWFFLKKNTPITKKSKNARMGKGKGNFLRWIIRLPKNFVFLELYNINTFYLKTICKSLELKLFFKLNYITIFQKNQRYLGARAPFFFFTHKYRSKMF